MPKRPPTSWRKRNRPVSLTSFPALLPDHVQGRPGLELPAQDVRAAEGLVVEIRVAGIGRGVELAGEGRRAGTDELLEIAVGPGRDEGLGVDLHAQRRRDGVVDTRGQADRRLPDAAEDVAGRRGVLDVVDPLGVLVHLLEPDAEAQRQERRRPPLDLRVGAPRRRAGLVAEVEPHPAAVDGLAAVRLDVVPDVGAALRQHRRAAAGRAVIDAGALDVEARAGRPVRQERDVRVDVGAGERGCRRRSSTRPTGSG